MHPSQIAPRFRVLISILAAAALAIGIDTESSYSATGSRPHSARHARSHPQATAPVPFRFFSSTSAWDQALAADAPLDPSSASLMAAFDEQIEAEEQAKTGPWINTTSYSVPIYTVPEGQPTVAVTLEDHVAEPALSSAWSAVPLPSNALPANGYRRHPRSSGSRAPTGYGNSGDSPTKAAPGTPSGAARSEKSRLTLVSTDRSVAGRPKLLGSLRVLDVSRRRPDLP